MSGSRSKRPIRPELRKRSMSGALTMLTIGVRRSRRHRAPLAQDRQQLVDVARPPPAIGMTVGDRLDQHRAQVAHILVGQEQERDRREIAEHVHGVLLELAHALEERDGVAVVFDADAHQRRQRGVEQFGDLLQRLDLDEFALLQPVDRGARDADRIGDLAHRQVLAEPIGAQPSADFGQLFGHRSPRDPPRCGGDGHCFGSCCLIFIWMAAPNISG